MSTVNILAVQRAAYLREGAPSLTKRRRDLKKFKTAMLARRSAIEDDKHRLRPSVAPRDGADGNRGRRRPCRARRVARVAGASGRGLRDCGQRDAAVS